VVFSCSKFCVQNNLEQAKIKDVTTGLLRIYDSFSMAFLSVLVSCLI